MVGNLVALMQKKKKKQQLCVTLRRRCDTRKESGRCGSMWHGRLVSPCM